MTYWAPSSPGDLADRYTILQLKVERADSDAKRRAALDVIRLLQLPEFDDTAAVLVDALARVNRRLWDLEDAVRRLMAHGNDGPEFVHAARGIPLLNDVRAHLKGRIDEAMGAGGVAEQKTYATQA